MITFEERRTQIEGLLCEAPRTMEELADTLRVSRRCMQNYVMTLRLKGEVYIKEYRPEMKRSHVSNAKVYAWGTGTDAEPFSRRELERDALRRKKEKKTAPPPAPKKLSVDWVTFWIPRRKI